MSRLCSSGSPCILESMSVPRVSCPCCRHRFALSVALADGESRELIEELLALGEWAGRVWSYAQCFRGGKPRDLPANKARRIIGEVRTLIQARRVAFGGKEHAVSREQVRRALDLCADAGKFDLKNHNYLKRMTEEEERGSRGSAGAMGAERSRGDGRATDETPQAERDAVCPDRR